LKDVIVRARQMAGFDSTTAGWDCHGCIEWKIEESTGQGQEQDDVPVIEFRRQMPRVREKGSRSEAEFKRLVCRLTWTIPTHDGISAEGAIVREWQIRHERRALPRR